MIRLPQAELKLAPRAASRLALYAFAALLVVINLVAFRHAIGWDVFYNTDSEVMLGVAAKAGWREALGWITGPWVGAPLCLYYRPTSSWLMWAEWALFGWNAAGYQWVGMGLHIASVLLFWRIAARLLGSELLAAVAALVFTARPRNVRTLAVLTAQPDLVAAVFMFLSLLLLCVGLGAACRAPTAGSAGSARQWRQAAVIGASLMAALLSLGGKEMALSLPLLASLIIVFDRRSSRREKLMLLGAYWAAFAAFMLLRTFAMSGLGYIPKGWRDPMQAMTTFGRSAGLYFAYPFAASVLTREWWPLAMFALIGGYAAAAWRRPPLRQERTVLYVAVPALIGAALGAAALCYETWAGILTWYPWRLLGLMLLYAAGAALIIARDRRAALFVLLWGLFAFVPAAYRVFDWSGKFFYIPHTFWALAAALAVDAVIPLARRPAR
ncbi:MAG: hypothetical protein JSV65_00400 [Armatimonadota bacterium]|nr:MAG: hypothetical protein JSV65_00400 [Armatimonadota bacterium]